MINEKAIKAANFMWSVYLLIMLNTLLLRLSLHFTQLHFTPLHYTCRHFTSSHLNFPQLHFTTLSFGLTSFKFPTAPFHLTSLHFSSLHFTSLHCPSRWFSPHFYSCSKTLWGWYPTTETCNSLILVINCALLRVFVGWYINCKNMLCVSYIKSALPLSQMSTTGPYPELDESNHHVPLCFILSHHLRLDLASGLSFPLVLRPQLLMHSCCIPFPSSVRPSLIVIISSFSELPAKQWEFYTALLRSQDRFEPDSSASSGPYEKSHYSRTRKCLSVFKISVMILLSECIIWAYWAELYLFPECQDGYQLLIGEQYVRCWFISLKYVLVFFFFFFKSSSFTDRALCPVHIQF